MTRPLARALIVVCIALCAAGCATSNVQRRASVLDYLYPSGSEAQPPQDVALHLPLRVGIAFAPSSERDWAGTAFDENARRTLLDRIAAAFRDRSEIASVQVLPTSLLAPGGGFANLDQLAAMYGLDLAVLLSYEQVQFDDPTLASITYWTIVGAYVVEGDRNETRTMLDAAVIDIRSRALLFSASGASRDKDTATAVDAARALRKASERGFAQATERLIENLDTALDLFREQAKTGTVRGAGTPALTVSGQARGGSGAGGFDLLGLGLALLALGAAYPRRG